MTKTITKETAIGEIIESCPKAAEILLGYGVHCVGCHVSPFEALGDGFRGHGLGDTEINEAVEKINAEIQKEQAAKKAETTDSEESDSKTKLTLTLTKKAADKLHELCNSHNKYALKIRVLSGGCSGFKYGMDLVDSNEDQDLEIEDQGVKIIINKESLKKITGAQIDYQDTLQGAGFKVINLKA